MKTMAEQSTIHSTFVIERTYPAKPERVFRAFADPAQKRRWFVDDDHHEVEHFEMDFRVGGKEQARFRLGEGTPVAGMICTNDTVYQDIVPNQQMHLGVSRDFRVPAFRKRNGPDLYPSRRVLRRLRWS
jgi:uncharacterized protein YndB with AHSA1/START domain